MECNDKNCPVHAGLKVRGNLFEATVVSDRMKNSVVVEREYLKKVPKYERLERSRSRLTVHKPECMEVKSGDRVMVGETRKLSKTKSFVVTQVVGGEK
ncbi:30S ribosomal protein S17 [archaeon]